MVYLKILILVMDHYRPSIAKYNFKPNNFLLQFHQEASCNSFALLESKSILMIFKLKLQLEIVLDLKK